MIDDVHQRLSFNYPKYPRVASISNDLCEGVAREMHQQGSVLGGLSSLLDRASGLSALPTRHECGRARRTLMGSVGSRRAHRRR